MTKEVEHLLSINSKLGEGPLWLAEENALYWVDIHQSKIERYQPDTKEHTTFSFKDAVTAIGERKAGGFVTTTTAGFAFWDGKSNAVDIINDPEEGRENTRFNDAKVGPDGRFWGGTMYEGPETDEVIDGRFYRLDTDLSIQLMDKGLTITNGMGWSPDNRIMYLTDTLKQQIYAYDFDVESGEIANRRVFVSDPEEPGFPDGMTVDSQGYVWSARWGGWKVIRYDPNGVKEREIPMPVECPSCCAFGGTNLSELYITTAWTALSEEQRKSQPLSGDIFRYQTEFTGPPNFKFAG